MKARAVSPIPSRPPKRYETTEEARQRQSPQRRSRESPSHREESVPQADEPIVIALDTDEELEQHLDTAVGEGSTRTTEDRTAEDLRQELEDPNLVDIFGYISDSDDEDLEGKQEPEKSHEAEESRETEDRGGEGLSLQEDTRGES